MCHPVPNLPPRFSAHQTQPPDDACVQSRPYCPYHEERHQTESSADQGTGHMVRVLEYHEGESKDEEDHADVAMTLTG